MPNRNPSDSSERLSPALASLLRAADAARAKAIPLPPVEPLLKKWERLHSPAKPAEVVPFADNTAPDALVFAARSGSAISAETRAKLAQLLREMNQPSKSSNGR
jgi:hypothetical protein